MAFVIPHSDPVRKPRAPARGFFFVLGSMKRHRVTSFIDGFNLYHAIANLKRPYLKWLDLFLLSKQFVKPVSEELTKVLYFSALAEHLNESAQKRQRVYLKALEMKGVIPVLGHFKNKDRRCPVCSHLIFPPSPV